MSMVVGPLQAALEEAIKAQQGLQLEVAQLTLKIEDLKEEHSEHIKDVGLLLYSKRCRMGLYLYVCFVYHSLRKNLKQKEFNKQKHMKS